MSLGDPGRSEEDKDQRGVEQEEVIAHQKVKDLAHRAISTKDLLIFCESLPKQMPHFDPARSTTSDVVRGAIIPLSLSRSVRGKQF